MMSTTLQIINAIVDVDNPKYNLKTVKGFIKRQIKDSGVFEDVLEYCKFLKDVEGEFHHDR